MDLTKNLTQQARIEDITLKEDFGTFVAIQDDDFGGSFGMDMDTFTTLSDLEKGRRLGNSIVGNNTNGGDPNDVDFFDDRSVFANNDLSKQNDNELNDIVLNDLNVDINTERPIAAETSIGVNKITDLTTDDTIMHEIHDIDQNELMTDGPAVVPTLFDDQPTVNATTADEPAQKMPRLDDQSGDAEEADTAKKVVVEKQIRTRRRRKLIIDEVKEIDSATMKLQLSDTSSILGTLELAPPTRKLMELKETGGVDKLFCMTARPLYSKVLSKLYTRNMTTKSLIDITNSYKSMDKTFQAAKESAYLAGSNVNITANDVSIEASLHNEMSKNNLLPLGDSYIDNNNDLSKSRQQDLTDVGGPVANDLDEFDQFGGPASIFNTNANIEELLGDYNGQINLEITPNSKTDKSGKNIDDSDEDEDEEEEENEDGTKKTNKSPNTSKKRHYRRSNVNNTSSKENKEDNDDTIFDDTLTNDPNKHLNKRAKTMVSLLTKGFNKNDNVGFFEMTKRNGKKSVVQKFYSLLVLKKYEIIDLFQGETYGDIIITKGDKFDNFTSS
jgi:cohesin complex subunit SCC1